MLFHVQVAISAAVLDAKLATLLLANTRYVEENTVTNTSTHAHTLLNTSSHSSFPPLLPLPSDLISTQYRCSLASHALRAGTYGHLRRIAPAAWHFAAHQGSQTTAFDTTARASLQH